MKFPFFSASSPASRGESAQRRQRQAAEWLALREARSWTTAEQAAFTAWCDADPKNAAMLAEVETAYRTFDRLAFYPRPADGTVDPDLLVRSRQKYLAPLLVAGAAAAAIAIAAVAWWRIPSPVAVPPPAIAATSHLLRLSDGSLVELNAGASLAENFTAAERRVRLVHGEAHFEVAKNPLRPFIVEAGTVSVRAVGTAFDVRLRAAAVDILVTEGKVGVTAADRPLVAAGARRPEATPAALGPGLILVAGQRTVVPTAPDSPATALVIEDLKQPQIDSALAWQSSRLVFDAMPLGEVVKRINLALVNQSGVASVQLTVADPALAAMRISGRIRSNDVGNFVQVLVENFGVRAERHGAELVLYPAP